MNYDRNIAAGMFLVAASIIIMLVGTIILTCTVGLEQAKDISYIGIYGVILGIVIILVNNKLDNKGVSK